MPNAPDTLVVTGPNFQQLPVGTLEVTPPGGAQGPLSEFLNGGTTSIATALTVFSSITPAGTNLATSVVVGSLTTLLGTAPSTAGVTLPPSSQVIGYPLLMINNGTAAPHVYGQGGDTIDTTAGTTGVTLTNGHRCFFTATAAGTYVSGPEGGVTS
jgi:hypothetical protein